MGWVDLEDYCGSSAHGELEPADRSLGSEKDCSGRQGAFSALSESSGQAGPTRDFDGIPFAKVSSKAAELCCNSHTDQYLDAAESGADWGGTAYSEFHHGTRTQDRIRGALEA